MLRVLSEDKLHVWNSIELLDEYQVRGGITLNRSQLVNTLCSYYDGELLVLSSPGYANIVPFHWQAAKLLKIVKDDSDDDDVETSIKKL